MTDISTDKLRKAIEAHEKWLEIDPDGKQLCLFRFNIIGVDLRGCNLRYCDLRGCDLSNSNLRCCDLSNSSLSDCDLRGCDLSGCIGLKSQTDFLAETFERTADGYIAYKTFDWCFGAPPRWSIEPGSVLEEVVNYNRTHLCGCGINVAPLDWVKKNVVCGPIWKVLIRWEWLPGVCVPYNSDGNIRCEKVELIKEVQR